MLSPPPLTIWVFPCLSLSCSPPPYLPNTGMSRRNHPRVVKGGEWERKGKRERGETNQKKGEIKKELTTAFIVIPQTIPLPHPSPVALLRDSALISVLSFSPDTGGGQNQKTLARAAPKREREEKSPLPHRFSPFFFSFKCSPEPGTLRVGREPARLWFGQLPGDMGARFSGSPFSSAPQLMWMWMVRS